LLLREDKEFWVHELFMERESKSKYRQLFPDPLKQPEKFFEYFRMNYGTIFCGKKFSTFTKVQNLFTFKQQHFNNVLFDVTVVIVFDVTVVMSRL
jgi:hypothetical protein